MVRAWIGGGRRIHGAQTSSRSRQSRVRKCGQAGRITVCQQLSADLVGRGHSRATSPTRAATASHTGARQATGTKVQADPWIISGRSGGRRADRNGRTDCGRTATATRAHCRISSRAAVASGCACAPAWRWAGQTAVTVVVLQLHAAVGVGAVAVVPRGRGQGRRWRRNRTRRANKL